MRLRLGEAIWMNVSRRRYSGSVENRRSARSRSAALRVVHALDADGDELAGGAERRQHRRAVGGPLAAAEIGRDADRERPHVRRVLTAHDGEAIPLDPSLDRPLHRLQELLQ